MAQGDGQNRNRYQYQGGQAPIQYEKNNGTADQSDQINGRQGRSVGNKMLQGTEVIGHPGHQFTGGSAFEKG